MKPFLLAGLLLCLAGCLADVEHSNPLDPLSDAYVGGAVVGRVVTAGPDAQPVEGAVVRLERSTGGAAEARLVMTGADGGFRFERVTPGGYRVTATKAGYTEQIQVVSVADEAAEVAVAINGMPQIEDVAFTTVLARQGANQAILSIEASLQALDPDGAATLDSAWVWLPTLGLGFALAPTQAPGVFAANVPVRQGLGLNDGGRLVGTRPHFYVRDDAGAADSLQAPAVANVFTEPLVLVSPPDFQVRQESPNTLEWTRLSSAYPIGYRVMLQSQGVTLIDTTVVDQRFIDVQTPLGPGQYEWAVEATDIFGNRNIGRAIFRISADSADAS